MQVIHAEMVSTRTDSGIRPGERLLSSSRKAAPMFFEVGQQQSARANQRPERLGAGLGACRQAFSSLHPSTVTVLLGIVPLLDSK